MRERISSHVTRVAASDGDIWLAPGSGASRGHGAATDVFNESYWPPVEPYIGSPSDMNVELLAQSPVNDGIANCSHTLLVDDWASYSLHSCHACFVGVVDVASRKLDAQLTPIGLAQSTDKAEVLPCFRGSKSKECMRSCMGGF